MPALDLDEAALLMLRCPPGAPMTTDGTKIALLGAGALALFARLAQARPARQARQARRRRQRGARAGAAWVHAGAE
jgi:hypothetical protein